MDHKIFLTSLMEQKGIGSKTIIKLLEELTINQILETDFQDNYVIKNAIKSALKSMSKVKEMLDKYHISVITVLDEEYPELLMQIPDRPAVIFYKGNLEILNSKTNLAFVGSRNISDYGKRHLNNLISGLAHLPVNIISGMAFGIDALAHQAAIANNLKTVAVLAGSVHKPSPAQNAHIYKAILDTNGLIISEFSPNVKIVPGMFASRNRIVAGVSRATIIIEAGEKSGSLITGNLAFDYNREVYALPGSVDSKFSKGTNKIIKNGIAHLVESADDIVSSLGFSTASKIEDKNKLSQVQREIYDILITGSVHLEELASLLKKEISELIEICFELEMGGIIYKDASGRYAVS